MPRGMWHLSSLTTPPAMQVQSLNCWTAREVLDQAVAFTFAFKLIKVKHTHTHTKKKN